jgi:hypothetical protein
MGASKRAAEMALSHPWRHRHPGTRFMAVRFGNVLGSSGSVIPKFKEQIARGGPVTVTHPDIIRYFMTIPEAARLVLQAAAIGDSGQVLVLDMGEPVKIVDLARDLIRLSGHTRDEIPIVFSPACGPARSSTRNCWPTRRHAATPGVRRPTRHGLAGTGGAGGPAGQRRARARRTGARDPGIPPALTFFRSCWGPPCRRRPPAACWVVPPPVRCRRVPPPSCPAGTEGCGSPSRGWCSP